MDPKKLALMRKIMIGIIPVMVCGLGYKIYATKNKDQIEQEKPIFLANSKEEDAPESKTTAYKLEQEKLEKKRLEAEESQLSNEAFYNVDDEVTTTPSSPQVSQPQVSQPVRQVVQTSPPPRRDISLEYNRPNRPQPRQVKAVEPEESQAELARLYQLQQNAGIKPTRNQVSAAPTQSSTAQPAQQVAQNISDNRVIKGRSRSISKGASTNSNLINAVIHSDQTVTNGSNVKIRLSESIIIDGISVPRNSFVSGTANFQKNRMTINLESIVVNNNILPFSRKVYDKDGLEGIYLPENLKSEAAGEIGADAVSTAMNALSPAGGLISSAINTGKGLVRRKATRQSLFLKANYKIYIK